MMDFNDDIIDVDSTEKTSIIKVIGVGGAGGNAVKHMYDIGIHDVNFIVCNTDAQALKANPVNFKIQLGRKLTKGLGAGNDPAIGRESAKESLEEIKQILDDGMTQMVFITAGMGGGTGTGAAPVIAAAAKDAGLLTVAVVTIPYKNEGQPRINQALKGITELSEHVDSLLVINNERLREMYGPVPVSKAFANGDSVLAYAVKGLSEMISVHGVVNVDFADVKRAMTDSGVSIIGTATGSAVVDNGKIVGNRAMDAVSSALQSPLLNNNDILGAKYVLVNMFSSTEYEMTMDEMGDITDYLCTKSGASKTRTLIWGAGIDEELGPDIRVTVVATGFAPDCFVDNTASIKNSKNVITIDASGTVIGGKNDSKNESKDPEETARQVDLGIEDDSVENDNQDKIDWFYRKVEDKSKQNEDELYDVTNLDPIKCLPLKELSNESKLRELEETPAFLRRKADK